MKVRIISGNHASEGLYIGSVHEAVPLKVGSRSKTNKPDVVVATDKVRGGVTVRAEEWMNADADVTDSACQQLWDECRHYPWFAQVGSFQEHLVVYYTTTPGSNFDGVREVLSGNGYMGCRVEFREMPRFLITKSGERVTIQTEQKP